LRRFRCGFVVLGERTAEPPVPPAPARVPHVVGDRRERVLGLASPLPVCPLAHLMSVPHGRARQCFRIEAYPDPAARPIPTLRTAEPLSPVSKGAKGARP